MVVSWSVFSAGSGGLLQKTAPPITVGFPDRGLGSQGQFFHNCSKINAELKCLRGRNLSMYKTLKVFDFAELDANINRWCKRMDLAITSEEG